ncbi:Flp pilus assembly complex ATPase component TadA [Candidatus Parcubacteria bacterium]|nr:Flp pilus assembly complex ATPase component TadA [Candidatus Parcubacteria bacterium]
MEIPSIFLNRILSEVAKKNVPDLHLSVGSLPVVRINDQLAAMEGEQIVTSEILNKIIDSVISQEEAVKLKEDREIILVKEFAGSFRFRINIFYQKDLPTMSFHYISDSLKTLTDLQAPKIFQDFFKLNSGLIIIAGSNNSGKTTTAAAFIEEVNKISSRYIITIEDPIEYLFVNKRSIIEQRQVGRDVKSVIQGIDYCLVEDVDLVYINKIKKEFSSAVPLILELAAGNCLVVLEMNADNSIRAIEKILSSGEAKLSNEAIRYSLADVLVGIVVQKLVSGRGGVNLAAEVLLINSAVKSLIREGKIYQIESAMQTFRKEGMISMDKALEELVASGKVRQEDI